MKNFDGKSLKSDRRGTWDGSLQSAHFYHLNKSIRSGSWAKTRRTASGTYNEAFETFGPAFGIVRRVGLRRRMTQNDLAWQLYRMELAKLKGNEFAGLMKFWLECWNHGLKRAVINEQCRISRAEGTWLEGEIQKYVPVRGSHPYHPIGNWLPLRRMKSGVASDIIRRRRLDYKSSQVLRPQYVSPLI